MRDYKTMRSLIESAQGRFCSVDFIKADGSLRRMLIQPATLKFKIVGEGNRSEVAEKRLVTYKENNPNLMPVWDVSKQAIRSINLDTVTQIKLDKEIYNYGT